MRKHYNTKFVETFASAYQMYKRGEFKEAHAKLHQGLEMNPKDGPSKTLIEVIEDFNMQAPKDWAGYRALTNK